MATGRRRLTGKIQLTRRAWEDVAPELERILNRWWEASENGVPAGFKDQLPRRSTVGSSGSSGSMLSGWAAADHLHPNPTGPPAGLSNAAAEGSSTSTPRLDHQHKRDLRVKEDSADVAVRNALDFVNADLEWEITDDPGNDDINIVGKLSDVSRTFVAGGTRPSASGASDAIVWEAPYDATVIAVRGIRLNGGSGATVNARRNFVDEHLASDLSLPTLGTVYDGGAVQNTAYVAGDILEARIKSVSGGIADITVLIRLRRD